MLYEQQLGHRFESALLHRVGLLADKYQSDYLNSKQNFLI
jgi:hypothetical protein